VTQIIAKLDDLPRRQGTVNVMIHDSCSCYLHRNEPTCQVSAYVTYVMLNNIGSGVTWFTPGVVDLNNIGYETMISF